MPPITLTIHARDYHKEGIAGEWQEPQARHDRRLAELTGSYGHKSDELAYAATVDAHGTLERVGTGLVDCANRPRWTPSGSLSYSQIASPTSSLRPST